ncbi:MAG TPA: trigger factor [Syntrophales bacterium]|nr:trigger factor [Syntrophales bacterium]HQN79069.1 trigger factor [Syntrophales bacterium]
MEIENVVKVEDVSPVEKKLSFEIPWSEVKTELDRSYRTIGKKANIKGFRAGKIPRHILEKYFKEESEQETVMNLLNRYYFEALKEKDLRPAGEPSIDQKGIAPEENFVFTATVEVEPDIDPVDYEGLDVEKEDWQMTDEELESGLKQLQLMHSTLEAVEEDRGVEKDDFAVLRFEGKVDGVAKKELSAEHHMVQVGSGSLIPGFEDQLLGMKNNETRQVKVTFPEDYANKDLAGKEALFEVELKDIRQRKLPELNEEFVKNFEKYQNLDELRDDLRKSIVERNTTRVREDMRREIVNRLIEKNDVPVPNVYVEREKRFIMTDAVEKMTGGGVPREQAIGVVSNLHEEYGKQALRMVKATLVLRKVAEKEGIRVEDGDVEAKLRDLSERYGRDYESVRASFEKNENLMTRLADELHEQKTIDFLEGKANIRLVKKEAGAGEEKP